MKVSELIERRQRDVSREETSSWFPHEYFCTKVATDLWERKHGALGNPRARIMGQKAIENERYHLSLFLL